MLMRMTVAQQVPWRCNLLTTLKQHHHERDLNQPYLNNYADADATITTLQHYGRAWSRRQDLRWALAATPCDLPTACSDYLLPWNI